MKNMIRETKGLLRVNRTVTDRILQMEGEADYLAALYNGAIRGLNEGEMHLAFETKDADTVFSVITNAIAAKMGDPEKMQEEMEQAKTVVTGLGKDNSSRGEEYRVFKGYSFKNYKISFRSKQYSGLFSKHGNSFKSCTLRLRWYSIRQ